MSSHATVSAGSASRWGPLWGARPADWALSEDRQLPSYEAALERTGLEAGWRVLDIGCGAGAFLLLFAGPLAETEDGRVRVLLIVNADSEADIRRRLADDPWVPTQQLLTASIEPWKPLVGAERLAHTQTV